MHTANFQRQFQAVGVPAPCQVPGALLQWTHPSPFAFPCHLLPLQRNVFILLGSDSRVTLSSLIHKKGDNVWQLAKAKMSKAIHSCAGFD